MKNAALLSLRHFIINLLYKNAGKSVALPSLRRLASDFNLAKSTVQLAVDKLIAEGFVFSKQGSGNFTNPGKGFVFKGRAPLPLAGIIWGDGKLFFQDHYVCKQLSPLYLALCECGFNIRHISVSSVGQEAAAEEIKNNYIDLLVWIFPRDIDKFTICNLEKSGIKVIVIPRDSEFDCKYRILMDFAGAYEESVGEFMLEGRSRVILAVSGYRVLERFAGFRKLCSERCAAYTEALVSDNPFSIEEELIRIIQNSFIPDILCINGRNAGKIIEIMDRSGIDCIHRCRLIAVEDLDDQEHFCGILMQEPFDDVARAAAALAKKILNDDSVLSETVVLPVIPVKINLRSVKK